jgi:hypothetical protein
MFQLANVVWLVLALCMGGCARSGQGSTGVRTQTPSEPALTGSLNATGDTAALPAPAAHAAATVSYTVSSPLCRDRRTCQQFPLIVQIPAPTSSAAHPAPMQAKIEIVWPHGDAAVRDANFANITAYLIAAGEKTPPPCAWQPTVRLWAAAGSDPARAVAVGQKRMITLEGNTFPVWDFNDVDVSAARDSTSKLSFFATVDGMEAAHNVWVHAADARTIFPRADVPAEVTHARPASLDARIEIVWPHDNLPTEQATLANISVYLFEAGTRRALAPGMDWSPMVRLHWSLNADSEAVASGSGRIGIPRLATEDGLRFLAWDFNDVDVSAAQDTLNRLYFWVTVDGVTTATNIWAHGSDARTILPQAEALESCK